MWKFGAGRGLLSTKRVSFVDAEGNSCRLSTNKAHFVDEMGLCGCHGLRWCLSGPAKVPLGSLSVPLGTLSEPSREPLCASRGPSYASGAPPQVLANPLGTLREPPGGLPLKLLAYWEEAEHAAGVDEQDVLCANKFAALF